jgi:O-antigen/teichoic acid export membrane protein
LAYPYFILKDFSLTTVCILKLLSLFIVVPLLGYILIKWKDGEREIDNNTLKAGLALWELSLSVIVLTNIDAFFIVKILNYKELALYSIIGSIMIVYDFAREAIYSVYSQKYAETKNMDSMKLIKTVIMISIVLSLFYLASTNFILQILFKGKYSSSLLLLILFCIYNSLNLVYVIPSCYFAGQGIKLELRKMMAINMASIAVKLIFIFMFSRFGLSGFLFASIISQGLRVGGSYYISFKNKLSTSV